MKHIWKNSIKLVSVLTVIGVLGYALWLVNTHASNSIFGGDLESHKNGSLSALETPKVDTPEPSNIFVDKDGNNVSLSNFRGNIVVVNIWATWCAPCVREMPSLTKFAESYKDKGVKVIAVSVDPQKDKDAAITKLNDLSSGGLTFYQDPSSGIAYAAKVQGFPSTIIYDANGIEIARMTGATNWASQEVQDLFTDILKKYKPKT